MPRARAPPSCAVARSPGLPGACWKPPIQAGWH